MKRASLEARITKADFSAVALQQHDTCLTLSLLSFENSGTPSTTTWHVLSYEMATLPNVCHDGLLKTADMLALSTIISM